MAGRTLESVVIVAPLMNIVFYACVPYDHFHLADCLEHKGGALCLPASPRWRLSGG